jgi:hypothetical protein
MNLPPNNVFELDGVLDEGGHRKSLQVVVSGPWQAEGEDDYFCRVHAPVLLNHDKYIYGVDSEQAKSLAIGFVRSLLQGKRVIDAKGNPLRW